MFNFDIKVTIMNANNTTLYLKKSALNSVLNCTTQDKFSLPFAFVLEENGLIEWSFGDVDHSHRAK